MFPETMDALESKGSARNYIPQPSGLQRTDHPTGEEWLNEGHQGRDFLNPLRRYPFPILLPDPLHGFLARPQRHAQRVIRRTSWRRGLDWRYDTLINCQIQ